jgi:hypothetical protein
VSILLNPRQADYCSPLASPRPVVRRKRDVRELYHSMRPTCVSAAVWDALLDAFCTEVVRSCVNDFATPRSAA